MVHSLSICARERKSERSEGESTQGKGLGTHTLSGQVFRFVLASSSLAMPSAGSTIE